mgnify:CR=1 FL=1
MKTKIILSLITISVLSFASCGNSTTEEPEPTATPKPTFTPDTENSTTSESQSKSEINENDSQTSEGETIEEEVVATPTPAPEVNNSSSSYVMSDELKQDLKTLGATDAEIAAIKSEKDMTDLVDKLIAGGTTGNSGSTAGGGSSSADTGSSDPLVMRCTIPVWRQN